MATNPPITIGELSDVPAPGSGVASQWCQEVTRRTVHRFATVAARDAAYPAATAGAGAECYTSAEDTYWFSNGTTWSARYAPTPRMGSVLVTADQAGITALVDLTGFAVTFTAIAGHNYRADYCFGALQVTAGGSQTFRLSDGATDLGIIDSVNQIVNVANAGRMVAGFREVTGLSAGVHTLKLRGTTSGGTLTIPNGSSVNGRFAVYDVGA